MPRIRHSAWITRQRTNLCSLCGIALIPITISLPQCADDHGDTLETATLFPSGSPLAGTLEDAADEDVFRIDFPVRTYMNVRSVGTTDTHGTLRDHTGAVLDSDDDSGEDANFHFYEELEPGIYYLTVSGAPGNYAVTFDEDPHAPFPWHSKLLPFYTGTDRTLISPPELLATRSRLTGGQRRYFRFDVVREPTRATIQTTGGIGTRGRLLDSSLNEVAADEGSDGNFRIETLLDAGTYYVEVRTRRRSGDFQILAWGMDSACPCAESPMAPIDHGDTQETATLMSIGSPLAGTIADDQDVDIFRIDIRRGVFRFRTVGTTDTRGELRFGNRILQSDDDSGEQSNFSFTREIWRGPYYLAVSGATGAYTVITQLVQTTDPHDTAAGAMLLPLHTEAELTLGNPDTLLATEGRIQDTSDIDFYRIDVPHDQTGVTVRTTGGTNTYGRLLDSSLTEVADDEGEDGNFRIETELDAGIYYIEVRGHQTGTYGLLAWDDPHAPCPCADLRLPYPPANVAAKPGDTEVVLTWAFGSEDSILRHQYRRRVEGEPYGPWMAIPDSAPRGTNATSFAITGLENGARIFFQVRALNAWGSSLASNEVEARPGRVPFSPEHLIESISDRDIDVYVQAADLDGDGDRDVLAVHLWQTGWSDTHIVWYENDGRGAFSRKPDIDEFAYEDDYGPPVYPLTSANVVDLDGDHDLDVLAVISGWKLAWYENQGGGEFAAMRQIGTAFDPVGRPGDVLTVQAADLDGDADPDVVGAGPFAIWWWKNEGGGEFSGKRVVSTSTERYVSVHAVDLDGDGDADAIAGTDRGKVVHHVNHAGKFTAERVISALGQGPTTVHAADMDGDGDPDVLAASEAGISWYENNGTFAARQIATANATVVDERGGWPPVRSLSIHAADLDGDGDMDVLSAFESGVVWYENSDGEFSPPQVFAAFEHPAVSVQAADLDGDGDPDVLSGSRSGGTSAWYRNLSDHGDDHGDDRGAATLVTVLPAFLHGFLESPLDRDVFRVQTGMGSLRARSNGPTDTFGSLRDAEGRQLDEDDDDAPNFNFDLEADVPAGPKYVEVTSTRGETGAYTVSLAFEAADDHGDSAAYATSLGLPPQSLEGALQHADDRDVFRIDIPEGGVVTVETSGSASRSIVLTDANGQILAAAEETPAGTRHVLRADVARGTHYVELRASGDTLGEYTLSIDFVSHTSQSVAFEEVEVDHTFDSVEEFLGVADLDGDGDPDLVYPLSWHENQNGAFPLSAQRSFAADELVNPVGDLTDLDNDGDPDLLWSPKGWRSPQVDQAGWHENLGGGTFDPHRVIAGPQVEFGPVYAVDVDVDGDADVAFRLAGSFQWSENNSGGTFSAPRRLFHDPNAGISAAVDLDVDGDPDLLEWGYYGWRWYENDGGAPFSATRTVDTTNIRSLQTADLDRDGDPDLLVTIPNGIAWYENEGGGEFSTQRYIATEAHYTFDVRTADVDGDRDLDIVAVRDGSSCDEFTCDSHYVLAWYENYGHHTFSKERVIDKRGLGAGEVRTADLDGDGDADVILQQVGSEGFVYITTYRNLTDHGDDHGDDALAATFVPVLPAFLHGVLERPGDRDVFRVATGVGRLYVSSTGPTDIVGAVLGDDGSELPTDYDGGEHLSIAIKADVTSGANYVVVRGDHDATGPYTLSTSFVQHASSSAQLVPRL